MSRFTKNRVDIEVRRFELRRQESAAKLVPYISFIFTHVALVLFIVVAFFIDRLFNNTGAVLTIKIALCVIAVLFLASEWIYAISNSRRWKKNIAIIHEIEEEQRLAEEQERQRQYENAMTVEQLKNRALQFDLQRLRERREEALPPGSTVYPRPLPSAGGGWHNSVRPVRQVRIQTDFNNQPIEMPYSDQQPK